MECNKHMPKEYVHAPPVLHCTLAAIRQRLPPADSSSSSHSPSDGSPSDDAVLRMAQAAGQCRTLVVAFGSLGGQHDFQAACRRTGVEHALFIRDTKQSWFLLGLDGIGERSFAATLKAVAAEISVLQPRRLVLMGTSMGGYAAVRCALELQCDIEDVRVLAFAPQVCIDPEERSGCLMLPPMPFDANLHTAKRAWEAQGRGARLPSAIDALLRQGDHQPGGIRAIDVHVGNDSRADVYEAALLRRAAEEHPAARVCVSVITHEGMGHQVAEALRDDMLLDSIINDVVAGAADGAHTSHGS